MKKEYILLWIMIIIWSFSFIIVDNLSSLLTPLTIALYRFIVASLTFLLISIFEKVIKRNNLLLKNNQDKAEKSQQSLNITHSRKKDYLIIIFCSFMGGSLFFYVQYTAIELIGPSTSALLVCLLSPIFITALSLFFFSEKLNILKILGFILASIGTIILISRGDFNNFTIFSPNFLGNIFGLCMPILWAIYSTLLKNITQRWKTMQVMRYIIYLGTLELLILVLLTGELDILIENLFNPFVFINIVYIAILASVFGGFLWAHALTKLESSKVASFLYVEPFFTLLFSFLLGIEQDLLIPILGGILILIAVIIISKA